MRRRAQRAGAGRARPPPRRPRRADHLRRLLDQVALYLHVPIAELPPDKRQILETLYASDAVLSGKRILLVDDDIRNIFAMTSILERQNMEVFSAETGKEAIEKLENTEGIDIVLMDIHMPGMGGIEAARHISAARADVMIVLMSTYDAEDLPLSASACGAASYLHKERLSPDLLRRIWRSGA